MPRSKRPESNHGPTTITIQFHASNIPPPKNCHTFQIQLMDGDTTKPPHCKQSVSGYRIWYDIIIMIWYNIIEMIDIYYIKYDVIIWSWFNWYRYRRYHHIISSNLTAYAHTESIYSDSNSYDQLCLSIHLMSKESKQFKFQIVK